MSINFKDFTQKIAEAVSPADYKDKEHKGHWWYPTGKTGTHSDTGEKTYEYERHDEEGRKTGDRHWKNVKGKYMGEAVELDEAGPFSYGSKPPRKGSIAYNAMMKRKEQEKNRKPIEPKDQMAGVAKIVPEEVEFDEAFVAPALSAANAAAEHSRQPKPEHLKLDVKHVGGVSDYKAIKSHLASKGVNANVGTSDKYKTAYLTNLSHRPDEFKRKLGIKEEVELDEANFATTMKKAIAAHERGDHTRAKYHLDNAKTARYAMKSTEISKHKDLLDKYKELRDIHEELELDEAWATNAPKNRDENNHLKTKLMDGHREAIAKHKADMEKAEKDGDWDAYDKHEHKLKQRQAQKAVDRHIAGRDMNEEVEFDEVAKPKGTVIKNFNKPEKPSTSGFKKGQRVAHYRGMGKTLHGNIANPDVVSGGKKGAAVKFEHGTEFVPHSELKDASEYWKGEQDKMYKSQHEEVRKTYSQFMESLYEAKKVEDEEEEDETEVGAEKADKGNVMSADYKTDKSGRKYKAHRVVYHKGDDDGKVGVAEEVELDEAKIPVQHATDAVHKVLGQKSAVNFLTNLRPGSEKHTSWDKVNNALVKQGVKSQHIASIASHVKPAQFKEEVELDEAVKLNSKVTIHDPGKTHHGKVGYVGEIRHGAYKGAPKTYTVDYDYDENTGRSKSIQLDKKNIKQVKEEVELDEGQKVKTATGYVHKGSYGSDYASDEEGNEVKKPVSVVKRGRGRPKKGSDESGEVKKFTYHDLLNKLAR